MSTAALLLLAKLWSQPWYPAAEKWVRKMWGIHTTEFLSAIMNSEVMSLAGNLMQLELLSESINIYFLFYMVPGFYIDTSNYISIYHLKVEV